MCWLSLHVYHATSTNVGFFKERHFKWTIPRRLGLFYVTYLSLGESSACGCKGDLSFFYHNHWSIHCYGLALSNTWKGQENTFPHPLCLLFLGSSHSSASQAGVEQGDKNLECYHLLWQGLVAFSAPVPSTVAEQVTYLTRALGVWHILLLDLCLIHLKLLFLALLSKSSICKQGIHVIFPES